MSGLDDGTGRSDGRSDACRAAGDIFVPSRGLRFVTRGQD